MPGRSDPERKGVALRASAGAAELPAGDHRLQTLRWRRRLSGDPAALWARFFERLWIEGAGFGPRPFLVDAGDAHGLGSTRRIGGSHGVLERITATEYPQSLEYRVVNPSWRTYPVLYHRGTVAFSPLEGGGTEVRWCVEFVPMRGAGWVVGALTRWVIGRYLDALQQVSDRAGAAFRR